MNAPAGAGLELPGRDPAVEMCREAFAAMAAASTDPAVHAVAEEFRGAVSPQDVVALVREWRTTAGLYAAVAANGTQQDENHETKDGS